MCARVFSNTLPKCTAAGGRDHSSFASDETSPMRTRWFSNHRSSIGTVASYAHNNVITVWIAELRSPPSKRLVVADDPFSDHRFVSAFAHAFAESGTAIAPVAANLHASPRNNPLARVPPPPGARMPNGMSCTGRALCLPCAPPTFARAVSETLQGV